MPLERLPGSGFEDLYNRFGEEVDPMAAGFLEMVLTY